MKISLDDMHGWVVRCRTTAVTTGDSLKNHDTAAHACDRAFSEKSVKAFSTFGTHLDTRRTSLDTMIASLQAKLEHAAREIAAADARGAQSIRTAPTTPPKTHLNLD